MKKILFITILMLISVTSFCQVKPTQTLRGNWLIDSSLLFKPRDTTFTATYPSLLYRSIDSTLYYWNLSEWLRVGLKDNMIVIDTTSSSADLSDLIIDDNNASDTTTYSSSKIDSLISVSDTNLAANDMTQSAAKRIYDLNGNSLVFRQSTGDSVLMSTNGNFIVSGSIYSGGLVNVPGTTLVSNGKTSINGELELSLNTITSNYTVASDDIIILTSQSSAITITLPSSGNQGRLLVIKNEGTGDITLTSMYSGDSNTITAGSSYQLIFGIDSLWHKIN